MNTSFQGVFRISTAVLVVIICYYAYMVATTYQVIKKMSTNETKDMPRFSKIFWVPFIYALILHIIKRKILNASSPLLELICKN
jgi:hypothetical protein